jgi:hypothetical protein
MPPVATSATGAPAPYRLPLAPMPCWCWCCLCCCAPAFQPSKPVPTRLAVDAAARESAVSEEGLPAASARAAALKGPRSLLGLVLSSAPVGPPLTPACINSSHLSTVRATRRTSVCLCIYRCYRCCAGFLESACRVVMTQGLSSAPVTMGLGCWPGTWWPRARCCRESW